MFDYRTHIEKGSMFNTPPCLPVFAALQTLKWVKMQGGVGEMQKINHAKAEILYSEIDRNRLFIPTVTNPEDRSIMNICWVVKEEYKDLEQEFLEFATQRRMIGIKGHRSVGGFRASTYNALPKESVESLIDVMQEFESMKSR